MAEIITVTEVEDKAAELREKFNTAVTPMTGSDIESWVVKTFQPGIEGLEKRNRQLSHEKKALENERDQFSASLVAANNKLDEHSALFATITSAASKGGSKT